MNRFFIILAIAISLYSCKKESAAPEISAENSYLKFETDGKKYEFSDPTKLTIANVSESLCTNSCYRSMYILLANNTATSLNLVILSKTDKNIKAEPYNTVSPQIESSANQASSPITYSIGNIFFNQTNYIDNGQGAGEFTKVEITSIQNGFACGTFSACFTDLSNNAFHKLLITKGEFKHIRVVE